MKKIGIFYGSSTGTCEELAGMIADRLGVDKGDVHSADRLSADLVARYDVLLLGTSTWGDGELQDDWYDGIRVLNSSDLTGKDVALFGCGDSESYADTFCDAMGLLYEGLKGCGCHFIGGGVSADGYMFSSSVAVVDGNFVGLALDEVNESDRTPQRIDDWIATLRPLLD